MKYLSLLLLSVFSFASCKSSKELTDETGGVKPPKEMHIVFTMQRTPCFGGCPVDLAEFYSDGTIRYVGERFALMEGNFIAFTTKGEEFHELFNKYYSEDYKDSYDDPNVTDLPSTILSFYNEDGPIKTIVIRMEAPPQLREMEKALDTILKSVEQWHEIGAVHEDE